MIQLKEMTKNQVFNYCLELPSKCVIILLVTRIILGENSSEILATYLYSPVIAVLLTNGMCVGYFLHLKKKRVEAYFMCQLILVVSLLLLGIFVYHVIEVGDGYLVIIAASAVLFFIMEKYVNDNLRYNKKNLLIPIVIVASTCAIAGVFLHVFEGLIETTYLVSISFLILVIGQFWIGLSQKIIKFCIPSVGFYLSKNSFLMLVAFLCGFGLRNIEKILFINVQGIDAYIYISIIFGYVQGLVSQHITSVMPARFKQYVEGVNILNGLFLHCATLFFIWFGVFFISLSASTFHGNSYQLLLGLVVSYFLMGCGQYLGTLMNFKTSMVVFKIGVGTVAFLGSLVWPLYFFPSSITGVVCYQISFNSFFLFFNYFGFSYWSGLKK